MACCRKNVDTLESPTTAAVENGKPKPVSEFRTLLPQVLASTAKNLILLDLGMTLAFPTIVIPELLKATDGLSFTGEQASWFGAIPYFCQPAGSLVSGLLFEPLGRKRSMMLVNIPHILAWLLLYWATTTAELYAAGVIMGLGVGFMEAPIITYVGEISQPKWRGILTAYAGIFLQLGYVFIYFLGTVTDWRTAAVISASVPAISILLISQVPESPIWLLSKGRLEEAERSLCWLRGWVVPELVRTEFHELLQHNYKPDNLEISPTGKEESASGMSGKGTKLSEGKHRKFKKVMALFLLDDLCRRQALQPLLMTIAVFFFHHVSGINGTRPFLVNIFEELGSPIDAKLITFISSLVGICGSTVCMLTVGRLGKKLLSYYSISACAVLNIALCAYGFSSDGKAAVAWLPITLYVLLTFVWSVGMGQVPWILLSEVLPFRGRGLASGVAAAAAYVLGFVVTKTYWDLHNALGLAGVFGLYGVCSIFGCVYFYFFLPETEGKSLEEIEAVLENKFKSIRIKLAK